MNNTEQTTNNERSYHAVGSYTFCQSCVICDSAIEFPEGSYPYNRFYICDECKEAITFVKKQLKQNLY